MQVALRQLQRGEADLAKILFGAAKQFTEPQSEEDLEFWKKNFRTWHQVRIEIIEKLSQILFDKSDFAYCVIGIQEVLKDLEEEQLFEYFKTEKKASIRGLLFTLTQSLLQQK